MSEKPTIPKIFLVTYLTNDLSMNDPFLEEDAYTLEDKLFIHIGINSPSGIRTHQSQIRLTHPELRQPN